MTDTESQSAFPAQSEIAENQNGDSYPEWSETVSQIREAGGVTLLIGGVDTGKTSFARYLLNQSVVMGRRVAVLDTDLGQSEIGPPTCVGLAYAEKPTPFLSSLTPEALAFVGATSPPGHLLEYVTAILRMAHQASADLMIVDTGGYISGQAASRLHHTLFELLEPQHVVGLQRHGEVEPILASMRVREGCRLYTPPIPTVIGTKPPRYRSQRRVMRFAAYFEDARLHTFSFDSVVFLGPWLGSGVPVAAHLLKFLNQALSPYARVYYAEMLDRHLSMMVSSAISPDAPALAMAQQQLKARSIALTIAPRLKHLLIGLEGTNGRLIGLGLLEAIDFRRRTLGLLTPVRAPGAARVLRFGTQRVAPDGTELGTLKPGDF